MSKSFQFRRPRAIKYLKKKVQKGFDRLASQNVAANTHPNNPTNAHQNHSPPQPTAPVQISYPQPVNFYPGPSPPPPPQSSPTIPGSTPPPLCPTCNRPQSPSSNCSPWVPTQPPPTPFSTPYPIIPPSIHQASVQNPPTLYPAQPLQHNHAQNITSPFSPQYPPNFQYPPNVSNPINVQQTSSYAHPQNLATQSTAPQPSNYPSVQPPQNSHVENAPSSYIPPQPLPNHHAQPASSSPAPLPNFSRAIITEECLLQMRTRQYSAWKSLGRNAVIEARKGLSRVLTSTKEDIDLFADQLQNSKVEAVEPNWNIHDDVPCFALSYVQCQDIDHHFKFSDQEWRNLHAVVEALADAGITHFRVWLDQCLWLRDASMPGWAHTGILPYVLWPVIALGSKRPGEERTTDSFERMWAFVEQIAGLWGMGVIIASEYRSYDGNTGIRKSLSYNVRLRTEPEQNFMIILLNVFHGAIDDLETGWVNDVKELKEMAVANIMYDTQDKVILGPKWKDRNATMAPLDHQRALKKIEMRMELVNSRRIEIFLDGSRTFESRGWDGVTEWFSGNERPINSTDCISLTDGELREMYKDVEKYNIVTENYEEYQLLGRKSETAAVWLLVAMLGQSSNFSRGRVSWTKVLTGLTSCKLSVMLDKLNMDSLQRVLREQLNNETLRVRFAKKVSSNIEWVSADDIDDC